MEIARHRHLNFIGRLLAAHSTLPTTDGRAPTMQPDRSSQLSSLAVIVAAALSFPLVMFTTLVLKLRHWLSTARAPPPATPTRTAIVTGGKMTKALCVCRQLKQSGCRVRNIDR